MTDQCERSSAKGGATEKVVQKQVSLTQTCMCCFTPYRLLWQKNKNPDSDVSGIVTITAQMILNNVTTWHKASCDTESDATVFNTTVKTNETRSIRALRLYFQRIALNISTCKRAEVIHRAAGSFVAATNSRLNYYRLPALLRLQVSSTHVQIEI